MTFILKLVDDLWNIRWVKGHRTLICKSVLAAIAAYQWASTATQITAFIDLPDLSQVMASGVIGYIALKLDQFAKEHRPTP